jgi:hypothetical protein
MSSRGRLHLQYLPVHCLEMNFYDPFITAANLAFACLENVHAPGMDDAKGRLDITCQQNHQDQESIRKPDVVINPFSYDAFPDAEEHVGSRTQRLSYAAQQPKASLLWKDALACIEFKRPTKTGLRQPKAKYNVEEYVPTKPAYRRVEAPVANALATSATGASQTQSGQSRAAPAERKH